VCVASVQAANIALTVEYAGSFEADGSTPLTNSPPEPLYAQNAPHLGLPFAYSGPDYPAYDPSHVHKFNVFMELTNTQAATDTARINGEDFRLVIFDMTLGPGLTPAPIGWEGDNPQFDATPAAGGPTGGVYSTNADGGVDPLDYKAIAVIANSANTYGGTHRRHPGENEAQSTPVDVDNAPMLPPTLLGSISVLWDGTTDLSGKSWVQVNTPDNVTDAWATIIGNTGINQPLQNMSFGPRSEWVVGGFSVDDLAGHGYLPGAIVSGGPLPTNDDDDPDSVAWSLVSLIGPDGAEVGASVDPLTGVFTWDSAPTDSLGTYTATIQGINAGPNAGTDSGEFTFRLVPEPTSITLLGLAMVGAIGYIRRR
jgi:hypothetical protein